MTFAFTKMHGAGNDYIYIDSFGGRQLPDDLPAAAVKLSRRRFSIGADGIIAIEPCSGADAVMRMFNADGSEGKMCGNGIRCVGKYMFEHGLTDKTELLIQTKSGLRRLWLAVKNGTVASARVDMGLPLFSPSDIPLLSAGTESVKLSNGSTVDCVSMGNPHAVCFVDDVSALDLDRIGPSFENDPLFPERVNTEFVRLVNSAEIDFRVYERGSGETLACGTGISAAVAVGVKKDLLEPGKPVRVNARGGTLYAEYASDGHIYLTGPAETVCEGTFEL